MSAPALTLFLAFYLYPAIQNIRLATLRWDGIGEPEKVGLRNFKNLLTNDDLFYKVLGNNIEFTFLVVLFQTSFSLLFAIYLTKVDRHSKIESTLKYQLLISTGLLTVAIFFIAHTSLPFVYYIKYNAVD